MQWRSQVQSDGSDALGSPPKAESLQSIYEQHLPAIYRFIYSKVGNRDEAEDLTSQVFIKAVRGLNGHRDAQSIQSWLFHVARTTIADHWRSFYRLQADSLERLLEAGWEAPAGGTAATAPPDPAQRVHSILSRLPARYREVLTYRFLLSCSVKETADRMNLSEANVKVLQFRALKRAAEIDAGERVETVLPDVQ